MQFLYGALGSHLLFPLRTALGQCFLTAATACVRCGVVSVFAESSSWRTGVLLVAAGVVLWFLLPTPLCVRRVHHMSLRVSVCVRHNCSTPPRVVLPINHLPRHVAMCARGAACSNLDTQLGAKNFGGGVVVVARGGGAGGVLPGRPGGSRGYEWGVGIKHL